MVAEDQGEHLEEDSHRVVQADQKGMEQAHEDLQEVVVWVEEALVDSGVVEVLGVVSRDPVAIEGVWVVAVAGAHQGVADHLEDLEAEAAVDQWDRNAHLDSSVVDRADKVVQAVQRGRDLIMADNLKMVLTREVPVDTVVSNLHTRHNMVKVTSRMDRVKGIIRAVMEVVGLADTVGPVTPLPIQTPVREVMEAQTIQRVMVHLREPTVMGRKVTAAEHRVIIVSRVVVMTIGVEDMRRLADMVQQTRLDDSKNCPKNKALFIVF